MRVAVFYHWLPDDGFQSFLIDEDLSERELTILKEAHGMFSSMFVPSRESLRLLNMLKHLEDEDMADDLGVRPDETGKFAKFEVDIDFLMEKVDMVVVSGYYN